MQTMLFFFFYPLLRSFIKTFLHFITRRCELDRLTYRDTRDVNTIQHVRHSLLLSKTLPIVRLRTVVQTDEFDCMSIYLSIIKQKRFANTGIWFVITSLRRTNVALSEIRKLGTTSFEENKHEPLLKQTWKALKPGLEYKRKSPQWSEIGFQGVDPATDLRGSGILSLENLCYFATKQTEVATRILTEHCDDVVNGGFPFAVTGINITFFMMDLAMRVRGMDDLFIFLDHICGSPPQQQQQSQSQFSGGNISVNDSIALVNTTTTTNERTPLLSGTTNNIEPWQDETVHLDNETREIALERFNIAYCYCFSLFARRWREANPSNAMQFQTVFKPFKEEVTKHAIDIMTGKMVGKYSYY
jgi:hypothetical protein